MVHKSNNNSLAMKVVIVKNKTKMIRVSFSLNRSL